MKKYILSALSLMMALTMSAITYQAQVSITLDDGTYLPALVVGESSDLAEGVNNGYAGEIQNLAEMPLAIYAIYDNVNYSTFATKSYTNLPVGIKTTNATTYHFYFDGVTGTVNLYDTKTGAAVPVSEGGDYEFTIDESLKNTIINDRFVINYVPDPSICFNYNVLEVKDHVGESLVVKQGDTEIANVPALGLNYSLDLSAYTGRLVVTLNGQDYQIDANPAVTAVP